MDVNYEIWEESKKHVFTPGGDPLWVCSKCGKGEHVYGIENNDYKEECPDCHSKMKYPWEIKGTLISNTPDFFAYNAYECGWTPLILKELRDKYMVFYHGELYGIRLIPIEKSKEWADLQLLVEDDGFLTNGRFTNFSINISEMSPERVKEITELMNEAHEWWITHMEVTDNEDDSIFY